MQQVIFWKNYHKWYYADKLLKLHNEEKAPEKNEYVIRKLSQEIISIR